LVCAHFPGGRIDRSDGLLVEAHHRWLGDISAVSAGLRERGARAVLTLGHDEYWSTAMRQATTTARDRRIDLAFLGGNEVYRLIRFADTPLGPDHR
jgi:hypothetical protein